MKIHAPDGRMVEAEDVDFDVVREEWNEYKLKDGTVLKIKLVVGSVIRTEDYNPMTGDPNYMVQTTNVVKAIVPEKLKRLPAFKNPAGKRSAERDQLQSKIPSLYRLWDKNRAALIRLL